MTVRGFAAYGALAAFWATFFALMAVCVPALGVALTAAVFSVSAAISLLVFAILVRRRLTLSLDWAAIVTWTGVGLVLMLSLTAAVGQLGAAMAAVVVSSIPLFSTVVAQARGLQPVTGVGTLSLMLGMSGLVLVAAFPPGEPTWGFLGGVISALVVAVMAGSCRRHVAEQLRSPQAIETTIAASFFTGVFSLFGIPFAPPVHFGAAPVLLVAVLGVGCGFLALFALSSASDAVPQRVAASLPGVGTVFAIAVGVVVLHEAVSPAQLLGAVLVLSGAGWLLGLVPRWFPTSWRT